MSSVASRAIRPQYGFSDHIAQLLDRIDCRPAVSAAEREAIFRLRYRAHFSAGTIKPSFAQSFTDPYDETDNVWLFGLYFDGELASSIRLHIASAEHPEFPTRKIFADVLEPELASGKIIVDPTRFVTDKQHSRANPGLPYATVRLAWLAAEHFGAAHFLAAVRVEHQAFYRRTFNHHLIGQARPDPLLTQPISLMTVNYASVAGRVHRRYPFFRSSFFERRTLFERDAALARVAFPPAAVANGMHHAA